MEGRETARQSPVENTSAKARARGMVMARVTIRVMGYSYGCIIYFHLQEIHWHDGAVLHSNTS